MDQQMIGAEQAATQIYDLRHGFRVGFLQLLLQAQTRSELVRADHICSIPDTPSWFVGFINHRGEAVPVYDLAASLGLESTEQKNGWLLLLDQQPATAALLLAEPPQGITDPQLLQGAELQPRPDILDGISSQQYRYQNAVWFELDHRAYFSAQKQRFTDNNTAVPA